MTDCTILRPFMFSRDGRKSIPAVAGGREDIPADLVPGLEREGYVRPYVVGKAISASPENKMIGGAPENKAAIQALRTEYESVTGKKPFLGWKAEELTAKIAEARAK